MCGCGIAGVPDQLAKVCVCGVCVCSFAAVSEFPAAVNLSPAAGVSDQRAEAGAGGAGRSLPEPVATTRRHQTAER